MRMIRARLLMAVVVGWGVLGGYAVAESPVAPGAETGHPAPSYPARTPPSGGPGYFPRTPPGANELPPGYPPVDNSHSNRPLRDWVQQGRPLGCWASFNGYGCTSLHSQLAFVFGSCRTFYGEPCLKGAPPSSLPPWAGPESGYHGHPLKNENGREHLPLSQKPRGTWLKRLGCPNCQ